MSRPTASTSWLRRRYLPSDPVRIDGLRPSERDRGAALVEAAMVTPVVVAAIGALVVTSVLWRDQLAVSDAAAAGARAAALFPSSSAVGLPPGSLAPASGTPFVVAAVGRALGAVPSDAVERVVVFGTPAGASSTSSVVPVGCRDGAGPAAGERCVVISGAAVADPSLVSPCARGGCTWRDAGDVEAVGVFIRVRQPRLLGGSVPSPDIEAVALAPKEGEGNG